MQLNTPLVGHTLTAACWRVFAATMAFPHEAAADRVRVIRGSVGRYAALSSLAAVLAAGQVKDLDTVLISRLWEASEGKRVRLSRPYLEAVLSPRRLQDCIRRLRLRYDLSQPSYPGLVRDAIASAAVWPEFSTAQTWAQRYVSPDALLFYSRHVGSFPFAYDFPEDSPSRPVGQIVFGQYRVFKATYPELGAGVKAELTAAANSFRRKEVARVGDQLRQVI